MLNRLNPGFFDSFQESFAWNFSHWLKKMYPQHDSWFLVKHGELCRSNWVLLEKQRIPHRGTCDVNCSSSTKTCNCAKRKQKTAGQVEVGTFLCE